ncbi:MAG TPA: hypothetical protein VJ124_12570 [Pyrinomonadaceae bacterium]|nr:hypothetical protein [Pyrinomonadaceae bacterium]
MDEITPAFAKLKGLQRTLSNRVSGPANYFDPLVALEYFERFANFRDQLKALLPDLYTDFPSHAIAQPSKTTDNEGRGYITRGQLELLLLDIEEMLETWETVQTVQTSAPAMKVTREGVFFAGQYFDSLQKARDILSQAKQSISLIDGYVNEDVLNTLTAKVDTVEVNVLTRSVSPSLLTAAHAFNKQYGKLSIRTSLAFHDRFVIIDNRDFYHFGASIKDLGNRGFMFSIIEEPVVIDSLQSEWKNQWAKATVVI